MDCRKLYPGQTPTLLYADGGTGKDYLKLQLAVARALGLLWIGLDVKSGKTLVLSDEDDELEMLRRLARIREFYAGPYVAPEPDSIFHAIAAASSATWAELGEQIRLVDLVGEDRVLGSLSRATGRIVKTPVLDMLDRTMAEFQPGLVCMPNLASIFSGNENDRTQTKDFIRLLQGLCIKHDCAMLVPAHPSLTGMARGSGSSGSTAWHNSVRARCYFEVVRGKEGDSEDLRTFRGKKNNYGAMGGKFDLMWKDGLFQRLGGPDGVDLTLAEQAAEDRFLVLLSRFNAQDRNASEKPGTSYAPALFADAADSQGITKKQFAAAMERLFATNKIRIDVSGPPSRRKHTLMPT